MPTHPHFGPLTVTSHQQHRDQRLYNLYKYNQWLGTNKKQKMARTRSRTRTMTKRKRRRSRRGIKRRRIPALLTTKRKLVRCKMVFTDTLSAAAGALAVRSPSLTNIVDPLGSATNQQPLGYDQWKALYDKAKIVGVKVRMTCHNASSQAIMFGMCPRQPNNLSPLATFDHYGETRGNKFRLLSPDVDHGTLSYTVSNKKYLAYANITDKSTIENDLNAESGPILAAQLDCYVQSHDKLSTASADIVLEIEYIVLLYDFISPSRSTHT